VCRLKHVDPSINFGIINSIAKLHLVGISTESSTFIISKLNQIDNSDIMLFKFNGTEDISANGGKNFA
jgi:hypothetical protein